MYLYFAIYQRERDFDFDKCYHIAFTILTLNDVPNDFWSSLFLFLSYYL